MASGRDNNRVTMEDVAARAGVSRALVSIVLRGVPGASDENRARVTRAAEELSYRPDQRARLLGRTRSKTIGVAFGLHDENHGELVEALYQASDESGYDLILSPVAPTRDESRAAQSLLDYRCEALVLIGPSLTRREIEALADRVPVIVVARALTSSKVDVARTDDAAGARLAVEHLLALGHRRVAHVHGGRVAGAAERRAGYRHVMRSAGLEPEWIAGGRTEDDGWKAAENLLGRSRPTAVFAYNDQCSAGIVAHLRDRGVRVPDDISIVGYDNTRLAGSASLALTSVAQDSHALARHVVERAVHRAGSPHSDGVEIVVPPRLVVRSTTAARSAGHR